MILLTDSESKELKVLNFSSGEIICTECMNVQFSSQHGEVAITRTECLKKPSRLTQMEDRIFVTASNYAYEFSKTAMLEQLPAMREDKRYKFQQLAWNQGKYEHLNFQINS